MQKLKNRLLDRMIQNKLTSNEVDFLLYISRFQDASGTVAGVHYMEVCEAMHISCQGFYDTKESLIAKGLIQSEKSHRIDHDITILGNDFPDEESIKEGYINTNHNIFMQDAFYKLKAGSKLLAMEVMKVSRAGKGLFKISTANFFEKYVKMFGVSKRVMRSYLMDLKGFFSIEILNGMYYVSPKKDVYKKKGQPKETENFNRHNAEVICRRNKIKDPEKGDLADVAGLMKQYKGYAAAAGENIASLLNAAVEKSLEAIGMPRLLNPKLIHKMLRELLGME